MVLGRWIMCGLIGIVAASATGCWHSRGCCHKQPAADCCPAPGPMFSAPAAAPAPPPPNQSFSVGPTCALPLP